MSSMIKWLKNLFKKHKDNVSTINIGKYNNEGQIVDTKDELNNLHKSGIEVFVGKRVYCKETELTYTLTTIDFDNVNKDLWWKPLMKLKGHYGKALIAHINPMYFKDSNGKVIDERHRNMDKLVAKGHNFEHRNLHNGDLIFIDRDRWAKENDIVMDVNSKLWEVKEIQGSYYFILTRKDGSYWETTIADIYGVVCLAYSLSNVTFL